MFAEKYKSRYRSPREAATPSHEITSVSFNEVLEVRGRFICILQRHLTDTTMSLLDTISQRLPVLRIWLAAGGRFAEPRRKTLGVLAALVMIYGLNRTLNAIARNHWQIRKAGIPWRLSEEIAVVTGGCSGFGLLTTKGLARKLRKVIVLDISDLPDELKSIPNVAFYKCDITSPAAMKETGAEIRRAHGIVSILINNAGIAHSHTILDTTPEYLEKVFKINVFSHWYTINEFLPNMLEAKKGYILTLASMASYASTTSLVDYSATKYAVLALHDGLNSELKHRYTNGRCIQT